MGIIDLLTVAVIALVTWCVASEGAVGAGTTFLAVLLSGLLAMNFFEPLADLIDDAGFIRERADMIALLGLFGVLLTLARVAAERLQPTFVGLQGVVYDIGRWGFGFLTAYATAGILLTALHTAPLPREFWGFSPERSARSGLLFDAFSPDREWLGFVQHVTNRPFARWQRVQDTDIVMSRAFDGRTAYHWGLHTLGSVRVQEESRRLTRPEEGDPLKDENLAKAAAQIIVPSFISRYAMRREGFGGTSVGGAPEPGTAPTGPAAGPNF